ncbi:MAG: AI-2E family transporter [Candidatus Nanohaloarchaea archaeon]|nr:AI-2E family transporter [Candidatus Nanohaloarchaea archaeon]
MKKEYVFLSFAVLSGLVALWMLWPFADALLWAGFTAYLLHYFADRLNAYVKNRKVTTAIMLLLLVSFVSGLFYLILTSIPTVVDLMSKFSEVLSGSVSLLVQLLDLPPSFGSAVQNVISDLTTLSREWMVEQLRAVPSLIIDLVIYFVVAAFLVKDGKRLKRETFEVIGKLPDYYRELAVIFIHSVDRLLRGVFLTYFVVAVAIGALATAGFYLMGIDFYWGWGLIIGIFAFFPIVSAPMVYVPLSLLYLGLGESFTAAIIFLYGVIVLNVLPEVLFRPYMAAHHTQEHPLLLFTGFIVGSIVLGFKGIILGPIILIVAKNMLSMQYLEEHS